MNLVRAAKTSFLTTIALTAALTLCVAAQAESPEVNLGRFNVPFSFIVQNKVLPAGIYEIRSGDGGFLSISSYKMHIHTSFVTDDAQGGHRERTSMLFQRVGEQSYLAGVTNADTGKELIVMPRIHAAQ